MSHEFPKPLSDEGIRSADVVVTMGCGDSCPVLPGKRYLDWELEDPAGKPIDQVRPIRDEIDRPRSSLTPRARASRIRGRSASREGPLTRYRCSSE